MPPKKEKVFKRNACSTKKYGKRTISIFEEVEPCCICTQEITPSTVTYLASSSPRQIRIGAGRIHAIPPPPSSPSLQGGCEHVFCRECILKWAQESPPDNDGWAGCPLCRNPITALYDSENHETPLEPRLLPQLPGLNVNPFLIGHVGGVDGAIVRIMIDEIINMEIAQLGPIAVLEYVSRLLPQR
jgi:hypothetical protein